MLTLGWRSDLRYSRTGCLAFNGDGWVWVHTPSFIALIQSGSKMERTSLTRRPYRKHHAACTLQPSTFPAAGMDGTVPFASDFSFVCPCYC